MTILHYYMHPKTYVEVTDKFIGVIELFNLLISESVTIKDFNTVISKDIDSVKSDLSAIKKKICVDNGCEKTVSGRIDILTLTLGTTKITMSSNISCNDEGFENVSKAFTDAFNTAIKSYDLDVFAQTVPVSPDELHCTVKVNDLIAIDVNIHIPAPGMEDESDEDYSNKLWIEFTLDLYNDSMLQYN